MSDEETYDDCCKQTRRAHENAALAVVAASKLPVDSRMMQAHARAAWPPGKSLSVQLSRQTAVLTQQVCLLLVEDNHKATCKHNYTVIQCWSCVQRLTRCRLMFQTHSCVAKHAILLPGDSQSWLRLGCVNGVMQQ